ncbi:hypothetical protein WAI453_000304 [Rhynchosporium graminicola]
MSSDILETRRTVDQLPNKRYESWVPRQVGVLILFCIIFIIGTCLLAFCIVKTGGGRRRRTKLRTTNA